LIDRQRQFLDFYRRNRVQDQWRYYRGRKDEFDAAQLQASWIAAILMILASGFAFVAASGVGSTPTLWRILAAALPAISAAVAALQRLFAFERLAKLYQDAATALETVGQPPVTGTEAELSTYVMRVERILGREQGQWGQLTADLHLPDGPAEGRSPAKPAAKRR
jgi:hypothetical protein